MQGEKYANMSTKIAILIKLTINEIYSLKEPD